MIDDPRDLKTTYRVSTTSYGGMHKVTMYPKSPLPIADNLYRLDLMPEWMRKGMEVLDVAGNNLDVPGVGRRTAAAYWFEANDLPSERASRLQRALNDMEDWHEAQKDPGMRAVGVDNTCPAD